MGPPLKAIPSTVLVVKSEVAKARRTHLALAREIEIELQAGQSVADLVRAAVIARHELAIELLSTADTLIRSSRRSQKHATARSAISRCYYSMYQTARGVVFFTHQGDDKNGHQDLPKSLPKDFPNRFNWQNELKSARLLRNEADYDPYPDDFPHWQAEAIALRTQTGLFLKETSSYLKKKGVI